MSQQLRRGSASVVLGAGWVESVQGSRERPARIPGWFGRMWEAGERRVIEGVTRRDVPVAGAASTGQWRRQADDGQLILGLFLRSAQPQHPA